jgi:YgiT-type zinc finger domain-containing protein
MGSRLPHEEAAMKCVICRSGDLKPASVTELFKAGPDRATVVVKGVPAQVCQNCGERYYDDAESQELLRLANEAEAVGVEFEIKQYAVR